MFHNGSMKDNLNFRTICRLVEKEKSARISYENDYNIYVYPETGEIGMEEHEGIRGALQDVGMYSQICWNWEIYKLLFILHNVSPVWIEVEDFTTENFHKVFHLIFPF